MGFSIKPRGHGLYVTHMDLKAKRQEASTKRLRKGAKAHLNEHKSLVIYSLYAFTNAYVWLKRGFKIPRLIGVPVRVRPLVP